MPWKSAVVSGTLFPVMLVLLGMAVYSNSFDCSFHFDDIDSIVDNPAIRDVRDLGRIWDFIPRRFVGYLSFALNYRFNRLDVFGYHVVNLAVHLVSSLLVWRLVLLIFSTPLMIRRGTGGARTVAAACALLFLTHPIQTQAVTYIVQRLASMAAMFYFASLYFYLKGRLRSGRRRVLFFACGALCALCGIFTKETVVTLPFAMVLAEVCFFGMPAGGIRAVLASKRFWISMIPFVLFLLVVPSTMTLNPNNYFGTVRSQRFLDPPLTSMTYLLTQFKVVLRYFRLLLLPIGQNVDHDVPASTSILELQSAAGLVFLLAVLFAALKAYPRYRAVSFGIFWFFLTLSVESSVKPLGNVMFEHRLYLPMFGFSLAAASLLYETVWRKNAKTGALILLAAVCALSVLTYRRNEVWKTPVTLWSDAVRKSPGKPRPYNNLGFSYYREGDFEEAIRNYRKALRLFPGYLRAMNNLGAIFFDEGKLEEAEKLFLKALKANPENSQALNNLGSVRFREGKLDEAERLMEKAVRLDPRYAEAYCNLGNVRLRKGDAAGAKTWFEKALLHRPDYAEAYFGLGSVYSRERDFERARAMYERTLALDPGFVGAYVNLGNDLLSQGMTEEATRLYEEALRIAPENFELLKNLGIAYLKMNDPDRAAEHFRKALAVKESPEIYCFLGDMARRRGELETAVARFRDALRLDPESRDAHRGLAVCYRLLGKKEESKKHVDILNRLLIGK